MDEKTLMLLNIMGSLPKFSDCARVDTRATARDDGSPPSFGVTCWGSSESTRAEFRTLDAALEFYAKELEEYLRKERIRITMLEGLLARATVMGEISRRVVPEKPR